MAVWPPASSRSYLCSERSQEISRPRNASRSRSSRATVSKPIGLGAIQDLAQERHGPVDLDRSQVRLDPVAEPSPSCPACAGERFGFQAELDEQRTKMCAEHAE
jgi:hypothetical protein